MDTIHAFRIAQVSEKSTAFFEKNIKKKKLLAVMHSEGNQRHPREKGIRTGHRRQGRDALFVVLQGSNWTETVIITKAL